MLKSLEENGRQLVAIVDPHLKRQDSYSVYKEAKDLDILLKTHQGKEYEAICWTGNSAWIDFFSPKR